MLNLIFQTLIIITYSKIVGKLNSRLCRLSLEDGHQALNSCSQYVKREKRFMLHIHLQAIRFSLGALH